MATGKLDALELFVTVIDGELRDFRQACGPGSVEFCLFIWGKLGTQKHFTWTIPVSEYLEVIKIQTGLKEEERVEGYLELASKYNPPLLEVDYTDTDIIIKSQFYETRVVGRILATRRRNRMSNKRHRTRKAKSLGIKKPRKPKPPPPPPEKHFLLEWVEENCPNLLIVPEPLKLSEAMALMKFGEEKVKKALSYMNENHGEVKSVFWAIGRTFKKIDNA